jgi:hypothetical protein
VLIVQLVDDGGRGLEAEYAIEPDGSYLALVMDSRSGPSGSRRSRNPDYNQALRVLLERLARLDAVLVDALVDSRRTREWGLPESDRRLIPAPIRLATVTDMEELRRGMGTVQAKIAQAPDATKGGNSTKRIRLRVDVPGYGLGDAARLGQVLAAPTVPTAVGQAEARRLAPAAGSPVAEAEEAIAHAAGKRGSRGRGQGFQIDQEAKVAVEVHAMNVATAHYARDWDVEDVHGTESFDLVCRRGGEEKHVEVKGTTQDGTEVLLTPNEVSHAREIQHVALFILSNVVVERADDGTVTATGGVRHHYDPWHIDDGTLIPLGFRYQVPDPGS